MIVYYVKSIKWLCLCSHLFVISGLEIASLIKKKTLNKRNINVYRVH